MKYLLMLSLLFACADPKKANLDKRLKTYKYPFKTRLYKFLSQTHKLEMAYSIVKPEKPNGKKIVLMHGKNFSGAYWGQTAKDLSAAGYTVLIPDQIGFGRSSKPMQYQYSFHGLAQNTKRLIDWYKWDKVTVLGHSMGGMLASRFALMYPELVDKLVLVNPIGLEDYKLKVPYETIDTVFKKQLKLKPSQVRKYQEENYYGGRWSENYERWLKLQTGWIKGPDWQHLAYISALTYDMIYTQPVVYEFGQLKPNTLLIIGDRDKTALGKNLVDEQTRKTMGNYPELAQKTKKSIPNSSLALIKDVGHLPHIEAYPKFKSALFNFLEK